MNVYAISDLHLSFASNKPMDVFGPYWHDHAGKIKENWSSVVKDDDWVILPGDHSWGMTLTEALPDLRFINDLPGKKILLKGNHDYWWLSMNKIIQAVTENGLTTLSFLYRDAVKIRLNDTSSLIIAGTRGWSCPGDSEYKESTDAKVYIREAARLEASIAHAVSSKEHECDEIVVFMHYPPFSPNMKPTLFTDVLHKYGIKRCFFGHLHNVRKNSLHAPEDGICYSLTSCDHTGFNVIPLL